MILEDSGGKPLGHAGAIDGFQSNAFYFPEDQVSVTYISNGTVFPVDELMTGVMSIFFNQGYTLPEFEAGNHRHPTGGRGY